MDYQFINKCLFIFDQAKEMGCTMLTMFLVINVVSNILYSSTWSLSPMHLILSSLNSLHIVCNPWDLKKENCSFDALLHWTKLHACTPQDDIFSIRNPSILNWKWAGPSVFQKLVQLSHGQYTHINPFSTTRDASSAISLIHLSNNHNLNRNTW